MIALNNAGLRRLVKNLSVTDEQSGLLKRASYLDLLMAETRRNAQQSTSLTVLLMQFGEKSSLLREFGESAVEATDAANWTTLCRQYPAKRFGIPLRNYLHRHRVGRNLGKRRYYGRGKAAKIAGSEYGSRKNKRPYTSTQAWRKRCCAASTILSTSSLK